MFQITGKELAKSVDQLLQLDEPVLSLSKEFLLHSKNRLFESLDVLQLQVENLNQVNLVPVIPISLHY